MVEFPIAMLAYRIVTILKNPGGGLPQILFGIFIPNLGEDGSHLDFHTFKLGWIHQLASYPI